MDKKMMLIIGVIAIVVVVGVAAYALMGSGDEDDSSEDVTPDEPKVDPVKCDFKFNGETRLGIFGNANGDDRLDQADVTLLKKLVNRDVKLDPVKNCFADANNDGKLTDADVQLVQNIVNKKESKLYYLDSNGGVSSIDYPLKGKIITHHVYPLDACIILDVYDDVIGMSNQGFQNSIGKDPYRYPGIGEKIINIGTPAEDPQAAIATGANIFLTPWYQDYSKMQKIINDGKLDMQIVQLPMSKNGPTILDQYGALITLGVMMQKEEQAYEYLAFIDEIQKYLDSKIPQIKDKFTFITPMTGDSTTEVSLDVPYTDGTMPGDVYTISLLPMTSVNPVVEHGCPTISMEEVYNINPSVIVIIMFHDYSHSVADIRNDFTQDAQKYKLTEAYKTGHIYGVNYYNIANYCGIPQLPLLASYIWPDLFDEDKGWDYLQTYHDKYTMYENPDVKNMGNAFAIAL